MIAKTVDDRLAMLQTGELLHGLLDASLPLTPD